MPIEHPVSITIDEYRSQVNGTERLEKLLLAFELLMRFDAYVLAASFLETEECGDDLVRAMLMRDSFTLGKWYELLRSLVSVVHANEKFDIRAWFIKKHSSLQRVLSIRNDKGHEESRTTSEFVGRALEEAEKVIVYRAHGPIEPIFCKNRLDKSCRLGYYRVDESGQGIQRQSYR